MIKIALYEDIDRPGTLLAVVKNNLLQNISIRGSSSNMHSSGTFLASFRQTEEAFFGWKALEKECFCAMPKLLHEFILSYISDITMML